MKELTITLTSELASALVVLREEDESLEATAARIIIEARRGHVSEPPEGPSDETTAPTTR